MVVSIQKTEVNFHGAKIKRGAPGRQFCHSAIARDVHSAVATLEGGALPTQKSCTAKLVSSEEYLVSDYGQVLVGSKKVLL